MSKEIVKFLASLSGLASLILTVLQVAGAIDWSWWAVTAGWWAPLVFAFALRYVGVALGALDKAIEARKGRK